MPAPENAAALLARLDIALSVPAYDLGKVPATRPREFAEMTLVRRYGGVQKVSARISTTGYRFTIAAVSQVSVDNVRNSLEKCRAELEFSRLVVAGERSTPIQFETQDDADYGSGWFSQYMAMTYAIRA